MQLKVLYELDRKIKYMEMLAAKLSLFSYQGPKEKGGHQAQDYNYIKGVFGREQPCSSRRPPRSAILDLLLQ